MKRRLAILLPTAGLCAVLALTSHRPSASSPTESAPPEVRGMTVSCPTSGWEWGTDAMVATMTELKAIGVNWIAIHPYAGIRRDGSVRWRRGDDAAWPPPWITRPITEAHRLGLKIMIKPHLAYWGRFSWRGAIEFDDPQEWKRFFASYEKWIVACAEAARGADAFVVGTELDATIHHDSSWRGVIAAVRKVYDGPLTYAANWSDFERVPFWDAVDVIGIQAYFPLVEEDRPPTTDALDRGWARVMRKVREVATKHSRDVVFTELGYCRSARAAHEPWRDELGGDRAAAIQERCLAAALTAIAKEPRLKGAFLWKWFPGDRQPRNFRMARPGVRQVIARHWNPRSRTEDR